MDLRAELVSRLRGRTCVVGVGNTDLGDDGVGVRLVEGLGTNGRADVLNAGTTPEAHMGRLLAGEYDDVLFVDAVEFDAEPGSVALLGGSEVQARFPQVSTHKISLGALAAMIERGTRARVWLLGVRPRTLRQGGGLSEPVERARVILAGLLSDVLTAAALPAVNGIS